MYWNIVLLIKFKFYNWYTYKSINVFNVKTYTIKMSLDFNCISFNFFKFFAF